MKYFRWMMLLPLVACASGETLTHLQAAPPVANVRLPLDHAAYNAVMPDGETAEVIGIATITRGRSVKPVWRSPDGKHVIAAPFQIPPGQSSQTTEIKDTTLHVIAVRIGNVAEKTRARFDIARTPCYSAYGLRYSATERSRCYSLLAGSGPVREATGRLTVAVTSGDWKTACQWSANSEPRAVNALAASGSEPDESVTFPDGRKVPADPAALFPHSFRIRYGTMRQSGSFVALPLKSSGPLLDWRVVAITTDDRIVTGGSRGVVQELDNGETGRGYVDSEALFPNVRQSQIDHFEMQTRPLLYTAIQGSIAFAL